MDLGATRGHCTQQRIACHLSCAQGSPSRHPASPVRHTAQASHSTPPPLPLTLRPEKDVFPVNSLNFHPQYGTFASAGGDGSFSFWDKDSKQRLKAFSAANAPIPCTAYSKDGSIFAYAVSYDWMRGAQEHNPATAKNHILLHPVTEAEAKSKPRSTTTRR